MQTSQKDSSALTETVLWLKISAHYAAFCAEPNAYLAACWWRLRGKRLRARYQFARLLGYTPQAYDLWRSLHEKKVISTDCAIADLPIVALIDTVDAGNEALERSLHSLAAEGIPSFVVGADAGETLANAISQIDWEAQPWLMIITAGDILAAGTKAAYCSAVAGTDARIAYADDDLLNSTGHRIAPHFKPDWNSELFCHFDYLVGACILQVSQSELQSLIGASDWARQIVAQRVQGNSPLHVPKVLHHRKKRPAPQAPPAAVASTMDMPTVTVIVPTRNQANLLRTCVNGIATTDYPEIDVIVVDNDSDDPETLEYLAGLDPVHYRVLQHAGTFNYSAINNRAAELARGQLLCLLNNDIEVIEPKWLAAMAIQAVREDVGAVGALLLYPDMRIQHAGVVLGMGAAAGHAHRLLNLDDEGYFRRHMLPQFCSAVTAACLVVARDRFLAVGGLDEHNFPVAFNDVDLCLRLNQRGWQSLYEPRATLIHHESVSRGLDRDPAGSARFASELAALQSIWGTQEVVDVYHHPELSRTSEQFVVRL